MIAVMPQMRLLVAVEPVDFRKGIDGLAAVSAAAANRSDEWRSVCVREPQPAPNDIQHTDSAP